MADTRTKESLIRFLARQPILTPERRLFGYEILARYGPENYCREASEAQSNVKVMDELFLMGIRTITEGLPAFVNCTREFLVGDLLTLMPCDLVVGEVLETVKPDKEVLAACTRMKDAGYRLALDDYIDSSEIRPLLEFADFVKIDVLTTRYEEQERLVRLCHTHGIPALAEKVETHPQFQRCKEIGYDYFQGYFFCRPQMVKRKSLPVNKAVYLQLLQAANEHEFKIARVAEQLKKDPAISYRLLRYLNSPWFGFRGQINSIPYALTLLGELALRKWISVVAVAALGDSVSADLLRLPLLRAMFCEQIAEQIGMADEANDLFLLGLLSVMDVLLNMSMEDVLAQLPVNGEITLALRGRPSRYRSIFEIVLDYESGTWEQLSEASREIGLKEELLPELYLHSVTWVAEVLNDSVVGDPVES